MPSLREQRLQERVAEIRPQLQKARELCEKADSEHREMTAEEQKDYDDIMAKGRAVAEAVKQHRHDQEVFAIARDLSDNVIGGLDGAPGGGSMSLKGKRLSFLGMGTKAATAMLGPDDTKALAPSGAAVMGQEFVADPVALGQVAQSLLDVLAVRAHTSAEYAYLRQTTRTNNARGGGRGCHQTHIGLHRHPHRAVAGGGRAPVRGHPALLAAGQHRAAQASATSVLTTLRKGLTRLEVVGYTVSSIMLHPSDFEAVELSLSTVNAIEHLSLPFDAAARRLWGVPIVSAISQATGVGHVLAQDAVVLDTDNQGVGLQWSETSNSTDFAQNLIRARCEGRFGTSVLSPLGVVTCDLTP